MAANNDFDLNEAADAVMARAIRTAADKSPEDGFPHYADMLSGKWTFSPNGDWTGGFFVGQLWLAAAVGAGDVATARSWAESLRPRICSDTFFRGFLFWYGSALGAKLAGDDCARGLALEGAHALGDSFHSGAGILPLGSSAEEAHSVGTNETNIDGVPGGTPLLYWAAELTGDDELRKKARSHVVRHIEFLMNNDGSIIQSATFDPSNGALVKTYTHKGLRDDSIWARAQAWAMLGLAQAAHYEPDLFMSKAIQVCDWWCAHLPNENVSYWDFDAAGQKQKPELDTSATNIAAAALLKMSAISSQRGKEYERVAGNMIQAVVNDHVSRPGEPRPSGIVGNACYNHRIGLAVRSEVIWGTYFLLESLLTLTNRLDTTEI